MDGLGCVWCGAKMTVPITQRLENGLVITCCENCVLVGAGMQALAPFPSFIGSESKPHSVGGIDGIGHLPHN